MESKLISVIVAAYNIEEYIARCLESLIAQNYQNLEVIVVDDGSKDQTGQLCDEFAGKDDRIHVIHQQNMGLSGARNTGLKAATGSYIGFVDGDDWVEPDMYRALYDACEHNHAEMAGCAYHQISSKQVSETFSYKQYILSKEEVLDTYICDNKSYHIYNSVWSKFFRSDIVTSLEFPLGRKSEDIMYTTRAMAQVTKFVFLDTPYYNYVEDREDSIMNVGLAERRFKDEIPFWKEQTGYLYGLGMRELAQKASYQFYRRMLFYYVDFRKRRMRKPADELIQKLRSDKREIKSVYKNDFIKVGDKVRMKLILRSPSLYYLIAKLYDRVIIPLR